MASERQKTKGLMHDRQSDEPDLDQALAIAAQKQLELTQENNRHKEATQSKELGRLGNLLGGPNQAAISIAAIVAVAFTAASILCGIAMLVSPTAAGVLEKPLTLFIGIVATTLAYIFGARSSKGK